MESLPLLVELETSRLRMLVLKVRLPLTEREPAVSAAVPGARVVPLFMVRAPTLPATIRVPALTVVVAVFRFALGRVRVPVPFLVSAPAPERLPAKVVLVPSARVSPLFRVAVLLATPEREPITEALLTVSVAEDEFRVMRGAGLVRAALMVRLAKAFRVILPLPQPETAVE